MATRSLNRILAVSRIVLLAMLTLTVLLAVAAVVLIRREADRPAAHVRVPATTRLWFTATSSTTDRADVHFILAPLVWELSAEYRLPNAGAWLTYPAARFEQQEPDPLPSLAVAAALLSVGALLGTLIQYSVVWAAERRAAERVFP